MAVFRLKDVGEVPHERKKLNNVEARLLEEVTGRKLRAILDDFNNDFGPLGVTAMLWLAMRRAGHHVKYSALVWELDDLEYSLEDEAAQIAEAAESPDPPVAAARKPSRSAPRKASSRRK